MEHKSRDLIVGMFVLIGMCCFGWMVFRFGDLPGFVSKMDANQISIQFEKVPGIQVNSSVYFRGFSVGKVVEIDPPSPGELISNPDQPTYFSTVKIAISNEYLIPDNIVPKIFQRGLGSSYIDLTTSNIPSDKYLEDGMVIAGKISTGSQFISEDTQNKLDSLIVSLNDLSGSIQKQLQATTPDQVDNSADINANLTTAIMRFDETLRNVNSIIGNSANQNNVQNILSELSQASTDIRTLIANSNNLINESTQTVNNIDSYVEKTANAFIPVSYKTQNAIDELITSLQTFNSMLNRTKDGTGTIDRLLDDPDLYESLTDTAKRLSMTLAEMQKMLELWQEKGIKMKL